MEAHRRWCVEARGRRLPILRSVTVASGAASSSGARRVHWAACARRRTFDRDAAPRASISAEKEVGREP